MSQFTLDAFSTSLLLFHVCHRSLHNHQLYRPSSSQCHPCLTAYFHHIYTSRYPCYMPLYQRHTGLTPHHALLSFSLESPIGNSASVIFAPFLRASFHFYRFLQSALLSSSLSSSSPHQKSLFDRSSFA